MAAITSRKHSRIDDTEIARKKSPEGRRGKQRFGIKFDAKLHASDVIEAEVMHTSPNQWVCDVIGEEVHG